MRYTIKFIKLFGIPVKVHMTFPLILLFGVEGLLHGEWLEALHGVLLVLVVFTCVVLHELGHSLQARRYGVVVRDIVLLPIGGMARAERIPENPRQEIVMAISGPAVNAVIAGLIGCVMWFRQHPLDVENDFLSHVLLVNVALAVFNLVPAFPMDGGRILRGLLATRVPYLMATRYARNTGFVIAQAFAVLGFVYSMLVMLPLIAVFVFAGAIVEEKTIRARMIQRGDDGAGLPRWYRSLQQSTPWPSESRPDITD
jgi:Zn-dependent protease